jgi:RNA recognition motif-containing protein
MASEGQKDVKLMALDDVIKANSKNGQGNRIRNLKNRRQRRSYFNRRYREENPKKDNRRRIVVENLNKDMHNEDLQKLFEKWGKLTRCGIKFDKLGASKGLADIEFSTHEECEKAIQEIDNAEINGVKVRVKYAPNRYPKYSRRTRSAGVQRRNLRKANRNNRRGLRTRRTGRRGIIDRTPSGRRNFRTKRRNFARTLGRRRQEKKQN